jgi:hypothetical protein
MFDLKVLVKESCHLKCICDVDGETAAVYVTDTGFKFPVPVQDMKGGTFNLVERGFTLMKWMRKAVTSVNAALAAPDLEPVSDLPSTVIVSMDL